MYLDQTIFRPNYFRPNYFRRNYFRRNYFRQNYFRRNYVRRNGVVPFILTKKNVSPQTYPVTLFTSMSQRLRLMSLSAYKFLWMKLCAWNILLDICRRLLGIFAYLLCSNFFQNNSRKGQLVFSLWKSKRGSSSNIFVWCKMFSFVQRCLWRKLILKKIPLGFDPRPF
jgi:hypothetical protein